MILSIGVERIVPDLNLNLLALINLTKLYEVYSGTHILSYMDFAYQYQLREFEHRVSYEVANIAKSKR